MTKEPDILRGIKNLAIFPLPLVLLPHEFLPLHIFEPRYQTLLEDVQVEDKLFGVSRFEPTDGFMTEPPIESIGCVAEIRQTENLDDGRSNVLTIGVKRYRIKRYAKSDKPYIVAEVEFFEDIEGDHDNERTEAKEVFALFKRIAKAAHKVSRQAAAFQEIPHAPAEQLSFLVCAAINLANDLKYRMLETRSTLERLAKAKEILSHTVDQIEENAEMETVARSNGHSKKNLDLDGI